MKPILPQGALVCTFLLLLISVWPAQTSDMFAANEEQSKANWQATVLFSETASL